MIIVGFFISFRKISKDKFEYLILIMVMDVYFYNDFDLLLVKF